MRIYTLVFALFLLSSFANAITGEGKKPDFYIMGYETSKILPTNTSINSSTSDIIESFGIQTMLLDVDTSKQKKSRSPFAKASPVTSEENSTSFRKALESFQQSISGLCISQIELNLAFNVSAKMWIVVSGDVSANVRVVLKNPDEKCSKQ